MSNLFVALESYFAISSLFVFKNVENSMVSTMPTMPFLALAGLCQVQEYFPQRGDFPDHFEVLN